MLSSTVHTHLTPVSIVPLLVNTLNTLLCRCKLRIKLGAIIRDYLGVAKMSLKAFISGGLRQRS